MSRVCFFGYFWSSEPFLFVSMALFNGMSNHFFLLICLCFAVFCVCVVVVAILLFYSESYDMICSFFPCFSALS